MPRLTKAKLAIPALVVLLAAGAGAEQVWSQHEARVQLDALFANLPSGSHGHYETMSFNAFTRTLRVNNLSITRDGHPSLAVQEIALHHLSGAGTLANPFQATSVRLVNTEVWRGDRRLTAALVEGQNVDVLAPDVPPPPGTPSWLAAPGSGTLLAAGVLTAANITDDEGATLAALSVADYDNGHIRQASASGFADTHGNRIASAEAHALDLGGIDAVFDTGRYRPGEPGWPTPRPLIGHAEIMGVQSRNKDISASVDSVTLNNFAGRPFAEAPTGTYTKSPAFLRDAAAALAVGAASVTGLRIQDSGTKMTGTVSAFSVSSYADGALAQASLDDLAFAGADRSQLGIGHFELLGLAVTKLLHEAADDTNEQLIEAAGNGDVHLSGLSLARLSVTPPAGHAITLEEAEQSTKGSAPALFTTRLRTLSIPAASDPELSQGLGALGIDPLVIDLTESGAYDTAAGTAALDPMVLTARGLGSLSLSAEFTGVPHDLPRESDAMEALGGMGIGAFTLRFTNAGLVQRVIAMEAKQANKTPQELTDEAKLAGSFAAAALVPQQPDAGEQVAAFLADPRVLTVTATPAAPVPVGALLGAGRDAAKAALNLRLKAN